MGDHTPRVNCSAWRTAAAVFVCGAVGFAAPSTHAHFVLQSPASWMSQTADGSPQKTGPCGNEGGGTATGTVTPYVFAPGAPRTITINVNETIGHPGHYRVALATTARTQLPAPPVVTPTMADECASAAIQNPPVFPVLGDNISPHTNSRMGMQSFTVTVPDDVVCDRCTLQVLEFMSSHGAPCFYYHCADISIATGSAGTGGGAGTTGGRGGSSGSSGAGGRGGISGPVTGRGGGGGNSGAPGNGTGGNGGVAGAAPAASGGGGGIGGSPAGRGGPPGGGGTPSGAAGMAGVAGSAPGSGGATAAGGSSSGPGGRTGSDGSVGDSGDAGGTGGAPVPGGEGCSCVVGDAGGAAPFGAAAGVILLLAWGWLTGFRARRRPRS